MRIFSGLKLGAAGVLLCFSLAAAAGLPAELSRALQKDGISQESVSVWVSAAGQDAPVVAHRARALMQPASSLKIVTTLAGLDLLKPDFVWKTELRAAALPDKKGAVRAVSFIGSGDPHLMIENLWLLVEKLRQSGVRKIEGDILVDRSAFGEKPVDQGAFDGASERSYNVGADAALVNLKAVSITFEPEQAGSWARVTALPALEGFQVPGRVRLAKDACGAWKDKLKARFSASGVRFEGTFPAACGVKALHVARWDADDYLTRVFKPLLRQAGIAWQGKARAQKVDPLAGVRLVETASEPLARIVTLINKYSNNPMARHLFLTLSRADAAGDKAPATLTRSRAVVQKWLQKAAGNAARGSFIDNGSGLSRRTVVSAETLGRVLNYGFRSFVMPEFMASLPLAGYDGTMKKRPLQRGSAHIKTGSILNVRSIAGYVTDVNARRWTVVVMINGAGAAKGGSFTQKVIEWCASGAAQEGAQ